MRDRIVQVNVPVLGLVENMAGFICGSCGATTHIFGRDGARALAEKAGIDILGRYFTSFDAPLWFPFIRK